MASNEELRQAMVHPINMGVRINNAVRQILQPMGFNYKTPMALLLLCIKEQEFREVRGIDSASIHKIKETLAGNGFKIGALYLHRDRLLGG